MKGKNEITNYIETVCEQVGWKKAHKEISTELENHILDQKEAFIKQGMSDDEALECAIVEMGNASEVGLEFDRAYKPNTPWGLIALIAITLVLGFGVRIFMAVDLGRPEMLSEGVFSICAGLVCMLLAYFLDFTIIGDVFPIPTSPLRKDRKHCGHYMDILFRKITRQCR